MDELILQLHRDNGGGELDRQVREAFFARIGEPRFHERVVRHIRDERRFAWADVAQRVCAHRAAVGRWEAWEQWMRGGRQGERQGVKPEWPTLFAFLTFAQSEVGGLFPPAWETLSSGMRLALEDVNRLLGRDPPGPAGTPTDGAWPGLVAALLRLRWVDLRDEQVWLDRLAAVLPEANRYARPATVSAQQLRSWVAAWFVPWSILLIGLNSVAPELPDD